MAALNPKLVIRLDLDPAGFVKGVSTTQKGLAGISKSIGGADSKVSQFKKSLASMWRITGGILLFNIIRKVTHALQGLKDEAINFEEQMRNVNSVAQLSEKDFAALNKQVIQLALDPRVREGPASLAEGLYDVTSAGYSTADALIVMQQAAMAASAGMTTSKVAADVIISTLGAYSKGVEEAGYVTNQLFQIVNISKYTFPELAASLDSVTPSAAALGIGIDEIGAAMAVFASHGVDAQTATVQMNAILTSMLKPTTAMEDALHGLGYETGQQMLDALGFVDTMKTWGAVVNDDAGMAAALFGDVRALRGEMNLTNDGGVALTHNLELMNKAQEDGGAMARALKEQMKSTAFQMDVLTKNIQVLATLGFGLLAPYLNRALGGINQFVSGTILAFTHFKDKGYDNFDALRAGIKKMLQEMFGSDVVTPVLAFFDKFVKLFYQLKDVAEQVFPFIKEALGFLFEHFDIIVPAILGAVIALKVFGAVVAVVTPIVALLTGTMAPLTIAMIAVAAIGAVLAVAWTKNWFDIQGKTQTAIEFIGKWLGKAWRFVQPVIDVIKELGSYFHDVATGDIAPFGEGLKKLPGWLQPIAYVLGRVIKTLRVFFKTWQDKGFLAAIKTIPAQIRAFGRSISRLAESMGLHKFAQAIKVVYYDLSHVFEAIIKLVDDVVHGRWSKVWGDLVQVAKTYLKFFIDQLLAFVFLISDVFDMIPWGTIGSAIWTGFKMAMSFLWDTGIPWVFEQAKRLLGALWDGLVWVWDEKLAPWLLSLIDLFTAYFIDAGVWLYQAGNDLLGGLWDGITDAWNWGVKNVLRFKDWIIGVFSGAEEWLKWAGHAIVNGLWNGIMDVVNWMKQHWNALWSWMPNALEKQFVIASPSKVFAEIGEEIPAGLLVGVETGIQGLKDQTKRLLDAYLAEVKRRVAEATITIQGQQKVRAEDNSLVSPDFYTGNSTAFNEWTLYQEKVGQFLMKGGQDYINWLEWKQTGMTLAKAIQEGFITEMQISSPSKVFMNFGKQLPRGLALGIKSEMGTLQKSLDRMGEISTPAYAMGLGSRRVSSPAALTSAGSNLRRMHFEKGSIVVNGAVGQNEEVLAEKVALRIIRASDNYRAGQQ